MFKANIKSLEKKIDNIVKSSANDFFSKIVSAYPVDTGVARAGWELPKRDGKASFRVVNNVRYASVLWKGRHEIGGKAYGSNQLPNGGDPILMQVLNNMTSKIKAL